MVGQTFYETASLTACAEALCGPQVEEGDDRRVFQSSLESSATAFHIGLYQTKCFPEVFSLQISRLGQNLAITGNSKDWCKSATGPYLNNKKNPTNPQMKDKKTHKNPNPRSSTHWEAKRKKIKPHLVLKL